MKVEVRFLLCPHLCRWIPICLVMCSVLYYQPETVCTLNHTQLDCDVDYPFLGNNVEVIISMHEVLHWIIKYFRQFLWIWCNVHRKLSKSNLRPILTISRKWFRSTWRQQGKRISTVFSVFCVFLFSHLHISACYFTHYTFHSDSEELPSTLGDNSKYISIPVKYEPPLVFSAWVVGLISDGVYYFSGHVLYLLMYADGSRLQSH